MSTPLPHVLSPSRLLAFKRIAAGDDWAVVWSLLQANFPLDESVFVVTQRGEFNTVHAAKRDGQRDVMLFFLKMMAMPEPSEDEGTEG